MPPALPGLYLAGFVDAPGGLLSVVEAQATWIAAVVTGRLHLARWTACGGRSDEPSAAPVFASPGESADSIPCDPHGYRRLLRFDLADLAVVHRVLRPSSAAPIDHGSQASGGLPR